MSPPHAKTSRVGRSINDDSSETLVLRKIWWAWHRPNELMVERKGESIAHPQGLHFGLKHPLALDQHRVDCPAEGRVVEREGELSSGRVSCRMEGSVVKRKRGMEDMMGCESDVAAQPAINSARKVPSAEGALRALGIEGKKIWKDVFRGS